MTKTEMNKRLAGISPTVVEQVRDMIRLGYGAFGITLECPVTIKEVNAVFVLAQGRWA